MEFFETSAKTSEQVEEAFDLLVKEIMKNISKEKRAKNIKLARGNDISKKRNCC